MKDKKLRAAVDQLADNLGYWIEGDKVTRAWGKLTFCQWQSDTTQAINQIKEELDALAKALGYEVVEVSAVPSKRVAKKIIKK